MKTKRQLIWALTIGMVPPEVMTKRKILFGRKALLNVLILLIERDIQREYEK